MTIKKYPQTFVAVHCVWMLAISRDPKKSRSNKIRTANPARIFNQSGLLVRNRNTDLYLGGKIIYPAQDFFARVKASSINAE